MAFQSVSRWFPNTIAAFVSGMTLLGCGLSAQGQIYSTTFNASQGYNSSESLSGQNNWNTNDADNGVKTPGGAQSIGQSDGVYPLSGYSTGTGDYQGYLGGLDHTTTVPGAPVVNLYVPFTLGSPTAYAFNVELAIAQSTSTAPNNDSFAFTFQNSGGTNLFSVNFTPQTATNPSGAQTKLNLGYSVNGAATATGFAMFSSSIYNLSVGVNVTNKTFSITLTPTNGSPAMVLANNVSLGTVDPSTVSDVAATWLLANTTADANGGYENAGSNALIFDNYNLVVPEPSAWLMIGVASLGAIALGRHRMRS